MGLNLTIRTFGGNDIQSATYQALFDQESEVASSFPAVAVESERPDRHPAHVRGQPDGIRLNILINVLVTTRANWEQLQKWFDPLNGEQYLTADDDAGTPVRRRILAFPERFVWLGPNQCRVSLRCAGGVWEANAATTGSQTITASGDTFVLTNAGNTRTRPTFTITPNTVMTDANSWIKRRRLTVANRSEIPLTDPVGDGYPIDLAQDALDTAALVTAGKLQADGDDLRVILNGEEIYRWLDGINTTTTKIWCNLQYRPRKTATIAVAMTAGSPANGGTLTVSNPEGTAGWPNAGFMVIEDEAVQYTAKTATTFSGLTRGARNTTAASHIAGSTAYWVEHPYLDVIYDYTPATNPSPPDDRKPLIDLATSTNTVHEWTGNFLVPVGTRRSRGWQPVFSDEGWTAEYVRLYEASGTLIFENDGPEAGKPRFNNVVMDCPVPIAASAGAVELDYAINKTLLLEGYLTDVEGYESLIIQQLSSAAVTNQAFTPVQRAYRLRLRARNGSVTGMDASTKAGKVDITLGPADTSSAFSFVLEEPCLVHGASVYMVKNAAGGGSVTLRVYNDNGGIPGTYLGTLGSFAESSFALTTPAWYTLLTTSPIGLLPGRYHLCVDQTAADTTYYGWYLSSNRGSPNQYAYNTTLYTGIKIDAVYNAIILSQTSVAEAEAPIENNDLATLDNQKLTLDSAYAPKIVLAPEETLYLHNFTLENQTTGQSLTVFMPARVGAGSVTIDCEARTITDVETGRQIPFALTASDPDEWLYFVSGANTIRLTEVGLVSVAVDYDYRSKWL